MAGLRVEICLEVLRKATKPLGWRSQLSHQRLKPGRLAYDSEVLSLSQLALFY
jgi:hypothetical protein